MNSLKKIKVKFKKVLKRLRLVTIPIIQCAIAAGIAWALANYFTSTFTTTVHNTFFAPIAALITLGINLYQRHRRSLEIIYGVCIGIIVASILGDIVGETNNINLVIIIAASMFIAAIMSPSVTTAMQSGTSAIIVSTLSSNPNFSGGSAWDRLFDTLIGAAVGLIVAAIIPTHPIHRSREKAAELLRIGNNLIEEFANGLEAKDMRSLRKTLSKARKTQALVNNMHEDNMAGNELSKYSPYFFKFKKRIKKHSSSTLSIDNVIRNVRVLTRNAYVAVAEDETIDAELVKLARELKPAFEIVIKYVETDPGDYPDAPETIRQLRKTLEALALHTPQHGGIYTAVMYSQIRSILTDLLQISGLSLLEAEETVPHKFIMDQA